MFGFDMFVHGVRGDQLAEEEEMIQEELEVYGVDWEGLHDDQLLHSQWQNNSMAEGWTSWVGHTGPPDHLNEVSVDPPSGPLLTHQVEALDHNLQPFTERLVNLTDADIIGLWTTALGYSRVMNNIF